MQYPPFRLTFAFIAMFSLSAFAQAQRPAAPPTSKVILPAPQKYEIKFGQPDKVGQQYRMFVKYGETVTTKASALGTELQNERKSSASELVAVATVLKLTTKGNLQKQTLQVEKFVKFNGSLAQPLLPAGTIVTAVLEGPVVNFYVKGRRVSEVLNKALHDVIGMDADDSRDMEAFEPATPKAVGESWSINVPAAIANLRREKITVAPKNLRGTVKLDRVITVGTEKFLSVATSMEAASFMTPTPSGVTLVSSNLRLSANSKLPVSQGALVPEESGRFTLAFVMKAKQDAASPEVTINTIVETTLNVRFEELTKTIASATK
jgi:hypothetical protein